MNSAARMAFLGTQTICDICRFWWNLTSQICRFRWNFSFPNRSFSTEFSIPSMCRFRWNFGNYMYLMFKYFLFKAIFQRFMPDKQRVVSLLKDFGHKYFLPKHFLVPNARQKMSFLVEFGGGLISAIRVNCPPPYFFEKWPKWGGGGNS